MSTVWPWWMAICGGPTCTFTVMMVSRDGMSGTPLHEICLSCGVYRGKRIERAPNEPQRGLGIASVSRDDPGTWLRGPPPLDPHPAARPVLPIIGDPVGARRRSLGIVPRYPEILLPVPAPVAEFPEGMGRGCRRRDLGASGRR